MRDHAGVCTRKAARLDLQQTLTSQRLWQVRLAPFSDPVDTDEPLSRPVTGDRDRFPQPMLRNQITDGGQFDRKPGSRGTKCGFKRRLQLVVTPDRAPKFQ